MKKKMFPVIAILVTLVASFGIAFTLRKNPGPDSHTQVSLNHEVVDAAHGHVEEPGAKIVADKSIEAVKANQVVQLNSEAAMPNEITIQVGETLEFETKDGKQHRIALGAGGEEHVHSSSTDSGVFGEGEGWRVRFDQAGTYYFHDHLNPNINVLVVAYTAQN